MKLPNVPLIGRDDFSEPSAFRPENMLREVRRQKSMVAAPIPEVCILDPDGDIAQFAARNLGAKPSRDWACFHTRLWEWRCGGLRYGVIGHAVGASYSVLLAEQAFVSGCELLVSVSSAGQIRDLGPPPYHVVVTKALRDEGTSYHYLPPATWCEADPGVLAVAAEAFRSLPHQIHAAPSWTTDAPFRETETLIASRAEAGAVTVEMEAAALYAFSRAKRRPVLCLAHVTNRLARVENDFEKGLEEGAHASLDLVKAFVDAWFASGDLFRATRSGPEPSRREESSRREETSRREESCDAGLLAVNAVEP